MLTKFLEYFQVWHSASAKLMEKWISPTPNWVKINFDMAIRDSFSAQAAVCHNSDGVLFMSSLISSSYSPNMGEALAARLAISLTRSLNMDRFIIEGDSAVVIQVLNNPLSEVDWRISFIILDSINSISSTSFWKVRKINRSANFCAYLMARWATTRSHFASISFSYPSPFSSSPESGTNSFCSLFVVIVLIKKENN
jgi:hypothetical protein